MEHKYLIDANIFITAHRKTYPFDIAPSFWKQLVDKAADKIIIIEKVEDEILRGKKDELAQWYNEQSSYFTLLKIPEQEVILSYSKIINSVNENEQYKQSAKDEFASIADSWLCAYGLAYKATIVTLETYQDGIRNKVKIPNICVAFDIRYIDMLTFMREIGMRF